MSDHRFLTDAEVGAIIRKSAGTVKRLRVSGALPYLPGRPPLVDRTDLEEYLARRVAEAAAAAKAVAEAKRLAARRFSDLTPAEQLASAEAWALKKLAKFPRARRRPPK